MTPYFVLVTTLLLPAALERVAPLTPSQQYVSYRKAYASAANLEDIAPFLAAEQRQAIASMSAQERRQAFELKKVLDDVVDIVIKSERAAGKQVTLSMAGVSVKALAGKRTAATGSATLALENDTYKLTSEKWQPK